MSTIFFDTYYDNASPLGWRETSAGIYDLTFFPDHERFTDNCQLTHWNFKIVASPEAIGTTVVLRLHADDNTWNGHPNPPLRYERLTSCVRHGSGPWVPVRLGDSSIDGVRKEIEIRLTEELTQICNVVPYTERELDLLMGRVVHNPNFRVYPIGATVEGRCLEMVEVGTRDAPRTVLLRARAHPWESGGSWLIEGLFGRLLEDDSTIRDLLAKVCICVMPMASKDGVARGMTRYNLRGCDLNRGWNSTHAFDPALCPENYALQSWLNNRKMADNLPDMAICVHNDDNGMVHLSPDDAAPAGYRGRMERFTSLLSEHTWFDEGIKQGAGGGTFGDGLCSAYGIDAIIYELNASWSSGLNSEITHEDWVALGSSFAQILSEYFDERS